MAAEQGWPAYTMRPSAVILALLWFWQQKLNQSPRLTRHRSESLLACTSGSLNRLPHAKGTSLRSNLIYETRSAQGDSNLGFYG
jgi:hypothetical protein